MKRKPPRTLLELAVARVGLRKGLQVLTVLVSWHVAATDGGKRELRDITLEEYGEWWKLSRSTTFRDQARFREAFPGEDTPNRIVAHVVAEHEQLQTARAPRWLLT